MHCAAHEACKAARQPAFGNQLHISSGMNRHCSVHQLHTFNCITFHFQLRERCLQYHCKQSLRMLQVTACTNQTQHKRLQDINDVQNSNLIHAVIIQARKTAGEQTRCVCENSIMVATSQATIKQANYICANSKT
jgi:hypothetical protein